MKFYTDGSRVGLSNGTPVIGWAAVCDKGVVHSDADCGGCDYLRIR